jgi:hypothetical protein
MEQAIRSKQATKAYDRFTDGHDFARQLTADLQAVSRDMHINVSYSQEILHPEPADVTRPAPEMVEAFRKNLIRENFGIAKLDILKGNIGYLKFNYLAPPEFASGTYIAAMNYLTHTDALVIDLRNSMGSMSPDAIPFLCSYFFEKPVHLNDIYWRSTNQTNQSWTYAYASGSRYLNKPIYVLTSGSTFSGAEELAYDLQNLKRATIIGDVTGGGANPGGPRRANDHFFVWVPNGRAINPVTQTNWEGVGVKPDVEVPAMHALQKAHIAALQHIASCATDEGQKQAIKGLIAQVEKESPKLKMVTFSLKGYPDAKTVSVAGTFNFWGRRSHPMVRKGDEWVVQVEVEPGQHAYKFVVDGQWIQDPANPKTEHPDKNSNSLLTLE